MSSKTYLYWIHLPEYADPTTQGYIGITCDKTERFNCHRNTFKEYFSMGAIITVLNEYDDREAALRIEADYRPLPNIGWNTYSGSTKRLTNSSPPRATTRYFTTKGKNVGSEMKLVNMRIPVQLWEQFQEYCSNELHLPASERMRQLMLEDIQGMHLDTEQLEFDFWG